MPLDPPTTSTALPLKSSSFIWLASLEGSLTLEDGRPLLEEAGDAFLVVFGAHQVTDGADRPDADLVRVAVGGALQALLQTLDGERRVRGDPGCQGLGGGHQLLMGGDAS